MDFFYYYLFFAQLSWLKPLIQCQIEVVRTGNFVFPDHREFAVLLHKSMMLAVSFSVVLFYQSG